MEMEITISGGETIHSIDSARVCVVAVSGTACLIASTGPNALTTTNTINSFQSAFNSGPGIFTGGFGDGGGAGAPSNGVNFTPTGLSFNRSPIGSANPMDRDFGPAFAPQGYFAHRAVRHRNNGFNFSIDPQAMASSSAKRGRPTKDSLGLGHGAAQPRSRWVTSLRGNYVDFNDDAAGADRDGYLWSVTSILGYRFSPNTTAGVFSRYRDGKVKSAALAASLDSEFYGGGVYLSTTAAGGVRFTGAALYERGDNDIAIAGATGKFDSDTVTLQASLDKRIARGKHWIEPAIRLL